MELAQRRGVRSGRHRALRAARGGLREASTPPRREARVDWPAGLPVKRVREEDWGKGVAVSDGRRGIGRRAGRGAGLCAEVVSAGIGRQVGVGGAER